MHFNGTAVCGYLYCPLFWNCTRSCFLTYLHYFHKILNVYWLIFKSKLWGMIVSTVFLEIYAVGFLTLIVSLFYFYVSKPFSVDYAVWIFSLLKAAQLPIISYVYFIWTFVDSCLIGNIISHLLLFILNRQWSTVVHTTVWDTL